MVEHPMRNQHDFSSSIRFSRDLSLWQVTARGLSMTLALSVFVLLGDTIVIAGPLAPLSFLLAALLITVNGLGYAELSVGMRRPGGAYILVHDNLGGKGIDFLTGWALALSSLGLSALLAKGASLYLTRLFATLFDVPRSPPLLAAGIIALAVLTRIPSRGNRRRSPFWPLLSAVLLVLLMLVAFPYRQANLAAPQQQLGPAVTLLVVAFVGLETIADHQQEIRRRTTNFPRLWLSAPTLVAALGATLAVIVLRVAGSEAVVDVPLLAAVGETVAGTIGQGVVLLLGIVIPLPFINRALDLTVRHFYVMSRDGYGPEWVRQSHLKPASQRRLVLLASLLAIPLTGLPTQLLAQTGGLLYLFTLMAVNLALARRPSADLHPAQAKESGRRFTLPFHPWIPALVLAVDLLVLPLWNLGALLGGIGCLLVGAAIYLIYGRNRHLESQEGVTIFRPQKEEGKEKTFRVLVPVANPATAHVLLQMAGWLARAQNGQVLVLQVVVVPQTIPLEEGRWQARSRRKELEKTLASLNEGGLVVQSITRVARSIAQGILDTAVEEEIDLILLGWGGPLRARGTLLGPVLDQVLRNAPCHVLVTQGKGIHTTPTRILVPTAGGPHAQMAAKVAAMLVETLGGEITLLCIQTEPATEQQMAESQERLDQTAAALALHATPQRKIVAAPSILEGIVQEAREHDLVMLGVSEETLLDRLIFGSIPMQVAARVPATALVQSDLGLPTLWVRRVINTLQNVLPILSNEEQIELQRQLGKGAKPGIDYFVLIVLSCIIAALGLLLDSPAVVIGAMLVAPLMSPILAFSLGLVKGDLRLIRFSSEAIFKGVALALVITAFIGLFSPFKVITGEMVARGRPHLLDMAVALASGMAGAYALARKDVSAALPGVAIAAALMPPLATVGLSLSMGYAQVAGGAFLLFLTNIAAISLAGGVVFLQLGIRPQAQGPDARRRLQRRIIASFILLLGIAIPLGITMSSIVRNLAQEQAIRQEIVHYLSLEDQDLVSLAVEQEQDELFILVTLRATEMYDHETVVEIAGVLAERLEQPVQLEIVIFPVVRSQP
ncbi:MAG: amino acid permease [Anaerolineae bacterium]|nr:amino acid permease [Anaerolineae bacterium]